MNKVEYNLNIKKALGELLAERVYIFPDGIFQGLFLFLKEISYGKAY